jgi:hypothetical protein
MMKIKLTETWTYRTPLITVDYPAGEHDMTKEAAAAAKDAGVIDETKEKNDGHGTATPRTAGTADKA